MIQMHVAVFQNEWKRVCRLDSFDWDGPAVFDPAKDLNLWAVCWVEELRTR